MDMADRLRKWFKDEGGVRILQIIVFVAVLLIVAGIRRLGSDYAHEVGIVIGAVAYLFLMVFAARMLDMELDFGELLINVGGSLLIAFFLKIFYFSADYSSSERLLFEDDRFYYRVKAIPKRNPVDSRTGELLEAESDGEMPYVDVKRFRQIQEEEMDRKFKGINLQSKLEQTLRSFAGGEDDDEETDILTTAKTTVLPAAVSEAASEPAVSETADPKPEETEPEVNTAGEAAGENDSQKTE